MSQQPPTGAPGPIPDPGPRQDPAMLHVTEQTRTYPSPNCGGTQAYDPEPAALKCLSCGTVVPVASDVAHPDVIAKRDLASTMADLARLQANAKTRVTGDKEVVCQNCGGRIMFSGTLTAVRCPFCNTPIQRNDVQDSPTRLPIDGVLPLRISERDARQRIEQWINSRRFAPNAFKKYRERGSFTSIYLPYFSYDAATTTRYTGMRGVYRTETYRDSEGRGPLDEAAGLHAVLLAGQREQVAHRVRDHRHADTALPVQSRQRVDAIDHAAPGAQRAPQLVEDHEVVPARFQTRVRESVRDVHRAEAG